MFDGANLFYSYGTCCDTIVDESSCQTGTTGGQCEWNAATGKCVSPRQAQEYTQMRCQVKGSTEANCVKVGSSSASPRWWCGAPARTWPHWRRLSQFVQV